MAGQFFGSSGAQFHGKHGSGAGFQILAFPAVEEKMIEMKKVGVEREFVSCCV